LAAGMLGWRGLAVVPTPHRGNGHENIAIPATKCIRRHGIPHRFSRALAKDPLGARLAPALFLLVIQ
jgi:hypothetical protein